jgi:Planctomycete cytochrome C/Chitobiase/beta-hexosaminidase C-terminal domain
VSRSTSLLENLLFFWIGGLVILLLGGDYLQVPNWLLVAGRLHPLLLHFPLVLLLLSTALLWSRSENWQTLAPKILLLGANFAGITSLAGLILATEDYEGTSFSWHKWTGIGSFFLATGFYFLKNAKLQIRKSIGLGLATLLLLVGHFGSNLTHGEDFLLGPLLSQEKQALSLEEAEVFRHVIQPILESKCVSCHKEGKVKGELRLDLVEGILKGGKSGPFFLAGNPEQSLFIQRIHLPLEEEDHMPPKNKPQLTEEELELLRLWVHSGGKVNQKVTELPAEDPFYQLIAEKFTKEKTYPFSPADEEDVAELNTFFRKVKPIYPGSPALEVTYFGASAFDPNSLEELSKVSDQVVRLKLDRMPLEKVDLDFLSDFQQLEEVYLNFTGIPEAQLSVFSQLPQLRLLALSGNTLSEVGTKHLLSLRQVKKLFLWQTGLPTQKQEELKKALPTTVIDFGYDDKGVIYPLNPPKIEFDEVLFQDQTQVILSHPIKSTQLRYTLDGSTPDSLQSSRYTQPLTLKSSTQLRVKAFAPGWIGSEPTDAILFKKGIVPASYSLTTLPNPRYAAKGASSLFDGIKGKANHTSGDWLGFTDAPFDLTLSLGGLKNLSVLEISLLLHESAYIFPPQSVELWVGNSGKWSKISVPTLSMSTKIQDPRFSLLTLPLSNTQADQVRIKLSPISRLPSWHPGAGAKGWVFVDEILIH